MTEKTQLIDFDVQDFLEDEEDCRLYLKACLAEDTGDGRLIKQALSDIAKARGMSQLAQEAGLTRAGLYRALSPESDPKFSTILHILKALKLDFGSIYPKETHAAVRA